MQRDTIDTGASAHRLASMHREVVELQRIYQEKKKEREARESGASGVKSMGSTAGIQKEVEQMEQEIQRKREEFKTKQQLHIKVVPVLCDHELSFVVVFCMSRIFVSCNCLCIPSPSLIVIAASRLSLSRFSISVIVSSCDRSLGG